MTTIRLSAEYTKQAFTQIDNVFINDYLSSANGDDVKIYLTGLMLANGISDGDHVQKVAGILGIGTERVSEGFEYWEKRGLIETDGNYIKYLSVKAPLPPVIKYNASKFKIFTDETVRIFPDKVFSTNEYNKYFEFITSSGMEINAVLLIMQYCKDMGGGKTSTEYILAVASSWAKDGLLTEKQIISRIEELETSCEDLRLVFNELKLKREPRFDDRQLFLSWQNEYGFKLDAILTAARSVKKGGTAKLDSYLKELYSAQVLSSPEIATYTKKKQTVHALCIKICKNIGVFYESTETLEETYILPWLNSGFEAEALEQIAKYCFLRRARDFESMQQMVNKFAKSGIFTAEGIAKYVDEQIKLDESIRSVYEKCGYVGPIGNRERENYRTWEEWGFDEKTIFAVAEKFKDKNFPMPGINRTLVELHSKNIHTVDGAIKYLSGITDKTSSDAEGYQKHQYTSDQLKHAFINFDNWD